MTACEPGKVFEFGVGGADALNTWGYRMAEANGGVDVTEYFRLTHTWWLSLYWRLLGWSRGRTNEAGMRTTLERMKAVVERA